jgi:hypothetical protein
MEQPAAPSLTLPPMRTFLVRRLNPVLREIVALEEIVVSAHSWSVDSGAVLFSTFHLKDNEPYSQVRRAFFGVLEVEETTPIPVEIPPVLSKIIH